MHPGRHLCRKCIETPLIHAWLALSKSCPEQSRDSSPLWRFTAVPNRSRSAGLRSVMVAPAAGRPDHHRRDHHRRGHPLLQGLSSTSAAAKLRSAPGSRAGVRNSRLSRPVGSGIGGSGSRCRQGHGSQGAWAGPRATPVQLPCLFILWRIVLAGSDLVWALLRAPQAAWRQKCGAGKQQCVRAGRAA